MPTYQKLPGGLWPVMLTPFKDDYSPDLDGLARLTDFYIDSGVKGLFANCLSSEMYQLTDQEKLQVIEQVVKSAVDRVPVVATGTFWPDSKRNLDFIQKVNDLGVAGVVMISGILVDPDEGETVLKEKISHLLDNSSSAFGIYECPLPYKRLLSPELLGWMAGTGRFIYHKDTSCDTQSLKKKIEAVQGTNFGFYNADTPTALDSMRSGVHGISAIAANFYPEFYSWFWDRFQENGATEELVGFHAQLCLMDRIVHSFYPYSAKVFLQKRGLKIGTTTRTTVESLRSADWIRFNSLYNVFQQMAEKYKIDLKIMLS